MDDEMNPFTGKGILICKKTGEVIKLGDVTIKEICNGELEPGDEHIELNRPSFIGGDKITFSVKIRSKRKWRKMIYSLSRPNLMKRRYISKREMIRAIHKLSEVAKVGHITESDEQLMRYSAKHLLAIVNHLYGIIQSNA
jgi:hypothetical protein